MKIVKKRPQSGQSGKGGVLSYFTGVPVKVFTPDGRFLFSARLQNVNGNTAQLAYLHSQEEGDLLRWTGEPFDVELRGYSSQKYRAIRAKGRVRHVLGGIWSLSNITFSESSDERRDDRLEADFNGMVVFPNRRNIEGTCQVVDISLGGVCLMVNRPTGEGERLLLRSELLEEAGIESLLCQVRYNRFDDGGHLLCGCQFEELSPELREKLAAFMERLALYAHGR